MALRTVPTGGCAFTKPRVRFSGANLAVVTGGRAGWCEIAAPRPPSHGHGTLSLMKRQKVLVRRQPDGSFNEVGIVTSSQGTALTLELDDGTEVSHERTKDELTPDRWSLAHLQRVAPAAVRQALAESPHTVFKQILAESRKAMRAAELKARLEDADPSLLDKAWKRAKTRLDEDPDVESTSERPPRYRLVASENEGFRELFPGTAAGPSDDAGSGAAPESSEQTLALDNVSGGDGPRLEPASAIEPVVASPESVGTPRMNPAAATSVEADKPEPKQSGADLARSLIELGARGDVPDDLTRRPLALSMLVDSLPASSRRVLAEVLAEPDLTLLERARGDLYSRSSLPSAPLTSTVQDAVQEMETSPSDRRRRLGPHLLRLLKSASDGGHLTLTQAVAAAGAFARDPVQTVGLTWTLDELAVRFQEGGSAALDDRVGADLARAAREVPLQRDGPRSRLLVGIFRVDAHEVAHPRWWKGVEAADLADAGRGTLGTVLEHPAVAKSVVQPAVRTYLQAEPTRQTVGAVLSWPSVLSKHVGGDALTRMMGAAARRDKQMATWIAAIADLDRVRGLERDLAEASLETDRLRAQHLQASTEAVRLRGLLDRSTEQMAAARQASATSSDAHDRQVRIDSIRSVAFLAAQVHQSSRASQDTALIRQVDHLCAREGLDLTEAPGARTTYDPAAHESLTARLDPGSPADVLRGGYTWADGDHRVVILKAQVVAAQE